MEPNVRYGVYHRTRLYHACMREDYEMVLDLLKLKADPNLADTEGSTPLSYCIQFMPWLIFPVFLKSLLQYRALPLANEVQRLNQMAALHFDRPDIVKSAHHTACRLVCYGATPTANSQMQKYDRIKSRRQWLLAMFNRKILYVSKFDTFF